jgi:sugar/nucleoside kinase (ribokinase family)
MKKYDVFCYGEIGVDNIIQVPHLPDPELAAFPTSDSYHIGGAAANTAVWLANFGFSVGLTGNAIGMDPYGQQLWDWLTQQPSIDLSLVDRLQDVVTPFCRAMVTPDGERTFLIYWYPQAPKTILETSMLGGARFLALDLYGGDERLAAAQTAWEAGLQTVIGDVVQPDHPILPLTSIATNSGAYIRDLYPDVAVREHAHRLQAISQGIVITTDGANPVYVIDRDGSTFTVRPPQVEPVDATGAGDAFRAGLLAGILRGRSLPRSVCWGVAAGALKVGRIGAATDPAPLEEVVVLADTLSPEP